MLHWVVLHEETLLPSNQALKDVLGSKENIHIQAQNYGSS